MEVAVILLVYLIGLGAAVASYIYWLRYRSELPAIKARVDEAMEVHREDPMLEQYLTEISIPQRAGFNGQGGVRLMLLTGAAMLGGILVPYFLTGFLAPGLAVRTIIGLLCILPFVGLASMLIAQEADQIRITSYVSKTIAETRNGMENAPPQS